MELGEYGREARRTAVYAMPGEHKSLTTLAYAVMGLSGEAGELANQAKKTIRDDGRALTGDRKNIMVDELGDVLWYCAAVAHELGVSLDVVAQMNLAKLRDRAEREAVRGDRRLGRTH